VQVLVETTWKENVLNGEWTLSLAVLTTFSGSDSKIKQLNAWIGHLNYVRRNWGQTIKRLLLF
jgi:hypothetical protein